MKNTVLSTLLGIFFAFVSITELTAQTSEKPWMGTIEVMYLDYQGPVTGKYLQFPAMDPGVKLSAHAFINKALNLSIVSGFVPNTIYPVTDEIFLSTSLIDASARLQIKSNGTFMEENAFFAPYITAGFGVNSASNINRMYIPLSLGSRIRISDNFGLNLEATYKQGIKPGDFQPIVLSGGLVFSIPSNNPKDEKKEIKKPKPEEEKKDTTLVAENTRKDSDGDGVPDEIDRCPYEKGLHTYLGCPPEESPKQDENQGPIAERPQEEFKPISSEENAYIDNAVDNIFFNSGSTTLKTKSYSTLDSVAAILKRYPQYKLQVFGHTDNVGGYDVNQVLSVMRAFEVKKYLVNKKGVKMSRVISNGFNFEQPIGDNETSSGRSMNRRVEFRLIAPGDTVSRE